MGAGPSSKRALTKARIVIQSLGPAVWNTRGLTGASICLTRFKLAGTAYETISEWMDRATGRRLGGMWLHGLRELLACFVPGTFFVDDQRRRRELSLYFLGDVCDTARGELRRTLSIWLESLFGGRPERRGRIKEIAEAANERRNWESRQVSTLLRPGVCPVPEDELFFTALTAHTADALASLRVMFRHGGEKILVPGVAESVYDGIELVAFPPNPGRNGGYWAYVISVSAATFPEKPDMYIVAHISMRNWDEARPRGGGGNRKLDVFIPPAPSAANWAGYRFSSFQYQLLRARVGSARPGPDAPTTMRFTYQRQDQALLRLLGNFCGTPALELTELPKPQLSPGMLCTMSRVWPGAGDIGLPIGVPYPDRADITRSFDEALLPLGFRRERDLVRVRLSGRTATPPVRLREAAGSALRLNVLSAARANGIRVPLDVYIFHSRDDTFDLAVQALETVLGPISRSETYSDRITLT